MKKIIFLILALNTGTGFTQNEKPFFEQIAFDFYSSKIIDTIPFKKKLKIHPYASEFHPRTNVFSNPTCLGISWRNNNQFKELDSYTASQYQIDSNRYELDLSEMNRNKFKRIKNSNPKPPILFISAPHKERRGNEEIFVNIYENHLDQTVIYHFRFNSRGEIVDWCKTVNDIIRIN